MAQYHHNTLSQPYQEVSKKTLSANIYNSCNAAPMVSAVQVQRSDSNSTVNLRVSLEYTGGGHINHFIVNFRCPNTSQWKRVGNFTAMATNNPLIWTARVADERFQYSKVELQLAAVNSNGYISNYVNQIEDIGECGFWC